MSDAATATPVATVSTPAAPATAAPVAPVEATPTPSLGETVQQNAKDIRQSVRDRASATLRAAEAQVSQPRNADGTFAPQGPTETAGALAPAGTADTSAQKPAGLVRINLSDDHPLRHRFRDGYAEVPETVADLVRWANNIPIRQREVAAAKAEAAQAREAVMRAEAAATAWQEQLYGVLQNPQIAVRYAELQQWNPDEAQRWLNGVAYDFATQVQAKQGEVDTRISEQQAEARGNEWVENTYSQLATDLDQRITSLPHFRPLYEQAIGRYNDAIMVRMERGDMRPTDLAEFQREYLAPTLLNDPHVHRVMTERMTTQQQAEATRIRNETQNALAKAERERLQSVQKSRYQNPNTRLPSAAQTAQTVPVQREPTARERREAVRLRVSGRR